MPASHAQSGKSLRQRALRLGALALGLAVLSGCQSIAGTGSNGATSNNVSELRVIDASPNAPGLDFYLNNTILVYNIGFGYNTLYVPIAPGNYNIAADTANTTQTLVTTAATLANGKAYTALVGNVEANLQETILTDQTQPAPGGEISVRFLDQATKVGAVDIYLIPSGATLITTLPFLTNITFGTNTGYVNIPAGTYAIAMVPTGTVPIATTLTLYTGSQLAYASGAVRTVVLIDQQITTTPGLKVMVINDVD